MKSKATLSLIEMVIMILVFAIAAAAALRVFVYADRLSASNGVRDFAVAESRNAAETVKHFRGRMDLAAEAMNGTVTEDGFVVYYDSDKQADVSGREYELRVTGAESGNEYLGKAEISVLKDGEPVWSLPVFWQEVRHD